MSWISETPLPLFMLALLAQVILGLILWQTGRGEVLYGMIGLACFSLALLVVEYLWVTPREQLVSTLNDIGDALETNDPAKVTAFIASDNQILRSDAERQLKRVKVEEARVSSEVRVQFPEGADPPKARTSFTARINAKFLKDAAPFDSFVYPFIVDFEMRDGRWLVTGYEMNRRL